ncbi:MAG: phage tail tube protein [Dehalococcoidales bacterium]
MATGVNKLNSVIGLSKEVTEGTYLAPSDWVMPLEGFSDSSNREELERQAITANIGTAVPRVGIKSASVTLPLEYKGSGAEGTDPESDLLLESMLGSKREINSRSTTKAGNTASQLEIEDADISKYSAGDMIVVLEAGDHSAHFITAVDPTAAAANITISPARSGAPSDNVEISMSTTYYPANISHPSLSASVFLGDEILSSVSGCKVASMSLDNFSVGQVPSLNFALQGMDFDRSDASSAGATYSDGLPFITLGACVYQDGVSLELQDFSFTVTNEIGQIKSTCSESGVTTQRHTKRSIEFSMNPYMDDTTLEQWDKFTGQELYSLVVIGFSPSAVAGEIDLGSVCGVYLPNCLTTSAPTGDVDNIMVDDISGKATVGLTGDEDDIFMSFA